MASGGVSWSTSGSFDRTEAFLKKAAQSNAALAALTKYGEMGRAALAAATPVDSGNTAASWYFEVKEDGKSWSIIWGNSNAAEGALVAVLLQHGHGTGTGGFVSGRDYINPALSGILSQMAEEGWKVVTQP